MDELPQEPRNLAFLRRLVTVLTATMILGVGAIVIMLFLRLSTSSPALPDAITLPDGAQAVAFTMGTGWYAIVTEANEILIYNQTDASLRQRIQIEEE